jgi:hypothetical protein
VLLAFAGWYLFFSRNGELQVWALLCGLAAAYFTRLALDSGRWRDWRFAGLFCGLGWYSDPGGVLILPTMLIYLVVATLLDGSRWRRSLLGGAALSLLTLVLLLPRLPTLQSEQPPSVRPRLLVADIDGTILGRDHRAVSPRVRAAVEAAVAAGSILPGGPADLPKALANQGWASLRAFVLMDPSLTGNPRYLAPGWPVLDSFTAALYFVGLFLGLRRFRQTALWWCLLVPALLVSSLARAIPDGARALPTLPAMLLFAGLTIDWLIGRKNLGDLAGLGLTLAIPLAAYWNWTHYVEWQRQPSNAAARQPAVEAAEFPGRLWPGGGSQEASPACAADDARASGMHSRRPEDSAHKFVTDIRGEISTRPYIMFFRTFYPADRSIDTSASEKNRRMDRCHPARVLTKI